MTLEYQVTEVLNSKGDTTVFRADGAGDAYARYIELTTKKPGVLARLEVRECGPWILEASTDPKANEAVLPSMAAEGSAKCEPSA